MLGEPKTKGTTSNKNSSTNNMETAENMSAGMRFCVEINISKTIDNSMYTEHLGDSEASAYITYSDYSMKNKRPCKVYVTVNIREVTIVKFKGD